MNKLTTSFLDLLEGKVERNETNEATIASIINAIEGYGKANPTKVFDYTAPHPFTDDATFSDNFKKAIANPKIQNAAAKVQENIKKLSSLIESGAESKICSIAQGTISRSLTYLKNQLHLQNNIIDDEQKNFVAGYCTDVLKVPAKSVGEIKDAKEAKEAKGEAAKIEEDHVN